jgi:hypothetical protein
MRRTGQPQRDRRSDWACIARESCDELVGNCSDRESLLDGRLPDVSVQLMAGRRQENVTAPYTCSSVNTGNAWAMSSAD